MKPTALPSAVVTGVPAAGRLVRGHAVRVQQHQPPRRSAEVMDPGHRLLPPVAALLEVHGPGDPAGLGRQRPVIGVAPQPRPTVAHPQCLERPQAGHRHPEALDHGVHGVGRQ
jgi:hypothetical protein